MAAALALGALAALLSACSWSPPAGPFAGADPALPAAPVRAVTDIGVVGAYQSLRPVAPRGWREQNERVAPQRRP
jgi:hypothetical protein